MATWQTRLAVLSLSLGLLAGACAEQAQTTSEVSPMLVAFTSAEIIGPAGGIVAPMEEDMRPPYDLLVP